MTEFNSSEFGKERIPGSGMSTKIMSMNTRVSGILSLIKGLYVKTCIVPRSVEVANRDQNITKRIMQRTFILNFKTFLALAEFSKEMPKS